MKCIIQIICITGKHQICENAVYLSITRMKAQVKMHQTPRLTKRGWQEAEVRLFSSTVGLTGRQKSILGALLPSQMHPPPVPAAPFRELFSRVSSGDGLCLQSPSHLRATAAPDILGVGL